MSVLPTENINEILGDFYAETEAKKQETSELGKEDFLKLLIAQIQNQDPLKPMESMEFTSQLSQFSSLEQLFNVNNNLEALQNSFAGINQKDPIGYIGKEVKTTDNGITLRNGEASGACYSLKESGSLIISIADELGREVRSIFRENQAGVHDLDWNGKDNQGQAVPDGKYFFEVSALDEQGWPVDVTAGLSGTVTAVVYQEGTPYLKVGEQMIDPENVVEVSSAD